MAANFANVALTDSFDTWRVRTNQIITDINTSTASAIANTVVRRDDTGDGGFSMGALNVSGKINSTLGTGTALELTSTKDIDINFQADSGALVVAGGASIAKDIPAPLAAPAVKVFLNFSFTAASFIPSDNNFDI